MTPKHDMTPAEEFANRDRERALGTVPVTVPTTTPRPAGEEEELKRIWATPRGFRIVTAVNNTVIGTLYTGVAFLFFVLAGILALVMRTQLAVGDSAIVSQDLYSQLFTVHGTTMMFLFAVPAVEALGVMLLPQMLAARDLPFPRLSAFAVWAYIIGGLVFFSTVFYGMAPKGGWFMYPPLTLTAYSPGPNADFWLLGIGFIEISAIAGAIEIIVGVLRTRPPGMSLDKMPIFAWAMLIFALMIVFAFPAVILATMLLEIERAFGWPFFTAALGGDALLWQHLFWFFGHPEVYIIFLPAAGLVSMMIPTLAQKPLVGYRLIVVALIATGFFSFGLWVHHMFSTGIPSLSLAFFSAASMAVSIPSGIQTFAWIATMASSAKRIKITVPSLFILGTLFIFVIGGITGVMVAVVPFDFQAHDSYFIVAHLHYVLAGGMVFPLFATFYYWAPLVSRTHLSERLGRWAFWLMFIGFNVAFFPMHLTGLLGMPRRVWTYESLPAWDMLNSTSTVGAYVMALGVLMFIIDLVRNFRFGQGGPDNPWNAGTLEFLPNDVYSTRSIPHITSRDPLWEQPNLAQEVRDGLHYLPNAPTGGRETIVTSAIDARPQYVIQMPGPSWTHVAAAAFMAACFLLLTIKAVAIALTCGVLSVACILVWTWQLDPPDQGAVDVGGGLMLPTYMTGSRSHNWWAMVVLMLVAASLFVSWAFSYLYLWTVSPDVWPEATAFVVPALTSPMLSAVMLAVGAAAVWWVGRTLPAGGAEPGRGADGGGPRPFPRTVMPQFAALLGGGALLGGAVTLEIMTQVRAGLDPAASSYGAMVYMGAILGAQTAAATVMMCLFAAARLATGKLHARRRVTYENAALFYYYTAAQVAAGLLLVHGFPRLVQ